MEIRIEKNYLILPTNKNAKSKRLRFFKDGREVYYLNVRLSAFDVDFYAYIDMRRFIGDTLSVEIAPAMNATFAQSNTMDGGFDDCLRPYIHFTTKRGWLNDPNGLIQIGDEYHMYYQYNPAERAWGNMHWGHAVSKDLLHWKELPTALFPDETGTIYSGCAVEDKQNVSGLGKGGVNPVLLYYTSAGDEASIPVPYTQGLAYSTDGLKTVKKCENNPVVEHIIAGNRDPKVVWCDERNEYVMALYLTGEEFVLLSSVNLLSWTPFQKICIPNDSECPSIFPLMANDGKRKWILTGAHDVYLIGDFVAGKFQASQDAKRLHDESVSYASQAYTDRDDKRIIRLAWLRGIFGKTFSQQMGLPCDLFLQNQNGEYYLSVRPIPELSALIASKESLERVKLNTQKRIETGNCALSLELKGEWKATGAVTIVSFGVEVKLDFAKNEIVVGKTVNPLSVSREKLDVRLMIDRASMEVFCDGGKIAFAISEQAICDGNLPYLELSSDCEYMLDGLVLERYNRILG